jgi:hypothetical protein
MEHPPHVEGASSRDRLTPDAARRDDNLHGAAGHGRRHARAGLRRRVRCPHALVLERGDVARARHGAAHRPADGVDVARRRVARGRDEYVVGAGVGGAGGRRVDVYL